MTSAELITIICACIGSGGLWSVIQTALQNRRAKKAEATKGQSVESKMVLGLAYAKLVDLCQRYIDAGHLNKDQYEDLIKYLYEPYKAMGGDGTVERLIEEVKKLPIRG